MPGRRPWRAPSGAGAGRPHQRRAGGRSSAVAVRGRTRRPKRPTGGSPRSGPPRTARRSSRTGRRRTVFRVDRTSVSHPVLSTNPRRRAGIPPFPGTRHPSLDPAWPRPPPTSTHSRGRGTATQPLTRGPHPPASRGAERCRAIRSSSRALRRIHRPVSLGTRPSNPVTCNRPLPRRATAPTTHRSGRRSTPRHGPSQAVRRAGASRQARGRGPGRPVRRPGRRRPAPRRGPGRPARQPLRSRPARRRGPGRPARRPGAIPPARGPGRSPPARHPGPSRPARRLGRSLVHPHPGPAQRRGGPTLRRRAGRGSGTRSRARGWSATRRPRGPSPIGRTGRGRCRRRPRRRRASLLRRGSIRIRPPVRGPGPRSPGDRGARRWRPLPRHPRNRPLDGRVPGWAT
jgi:hypothetical protein